MFKTTDIAAKKCNKDVFLATIENVIIICWPEPIKMLMPNFLHKHIHAKQVIKSKKVAECDQLKFKRNILFGQFL